MNKIIQGDCLEVMKDMPDNSIDMILTSPPYDNLRTYKGNLNWGQHIWKPLINEIYRVAKKGGVVVWIIADQTKKGSETGSSFKQALYFKEIGFNLHDTMIWKKQTFTDTGSLRVRYGGVFEYMFIFTKERIKTFNPIKDRLNKTVGKKKHGTIRQKDGSVKKISSIGKKINKYSQRFNVWEINTEVSNSKRCHPAQFPEKLAEDHIISWSNEGDLILDPMCGSGTTCVAAKQLNRKYIGIEREAEYCKIARDRIN